MAFKRAPGEAKLVLHFEQLIDDNDNSMNEKPQRMIILLREHTKHNKISSGYLHLIIPMFVLMGLVLGLNNFSAQRHSSDHEILHEIDVYTNRIILNRNWLSGTED